VDFNRTDIASERCASGGGYANEDYQGAQNGEKVFKCFAFHDRVLFELCRRSLRHRIYMSFSFLIAQLVPTLGIV
jgi:hypothetical protein